MITNVNEVPVLC